MADDLSSRSPAITIVEVSSLVILNVLSLTGNTLVCIAVYRDVRLRTTTNLYVMALAVADVLSAVLVMPFSTGVLISGKWPFGEAVCQLNGFFTLFVMYVSPVTMGLTAVNRYVRICRTDHQYKKMFSPTKSRVWLSLAWISVACYHSVPRLCGVQAYGFMPRFAICTVQHLSEFGKIIHYCIALGLFLFIPLITTIICYAKVARKIRQHNSFHVLEVQRQRRNSSVGINEIKLTKSLFAVVFAFMICWIPPWVIAIFVRFNVFPNMPRNIDLLCMFFMYFANAINPLIYAGMNSEFKRKFRRILHCESTGIVEEIPLEIMEGTRAARSRVHPETIYNDANGVTLRITQDTPL